MEKRHISVALYHRDHLSHGRYRQIPGHEGFHWGIMVTPKDAQSSRLSEAYDATDRSDLDKVTWRMNNPSMNWWFRARTSADSDLSEKLLGQVVIGSVEGDVSVKEILKGVPLPVKNTEPQQNCKSWLLDAVRALQREGLVRKDIDVEELKEWATEYADGRLEGKGEDMVEYPSTSKNS